MNQVKVWIKQNDISKINQGLAPTQYWTSEPLQEMSRMEMTISLDQFNQWVASKRESTTNSSQGKKILLRD